MRKVTLFVLLFFPVIGFSQQKTGLNLGITGGGGWGGVQGLQGHLGVNLGKFVSKGLIVGVSSEFSTNGYNASKIHDQYDTPGQTNSAGFVRNTQARVSLYSKYYFSKGRFSPFAIAEVGGRLRKQAGAFDGEPKLSNSLWIPHLAFGAGVSANVGKKRNMAIELSYLLENSGRYPSFNNSLPLKQSKSVTGKLNLGLQFFLK